MFIQTLLPFLLLRLLCDTRKSKQIIDAEGNLHEAFLSPWRFFAVKRNKGEEQNDIFLVRFFKGNAEWSVQFENIAKCYSFSRYCDSQSWTALYRTLRLLQDDAKYDFTIPF